MTCSGNCCLMVAWLLFDSVMMWLHIFCTLVYIMEQAWASPTLTGCLVLGAMVYHTCVNFGLQGSGTKFICTYPHRVARDDNGCHLQTFKFFLRSTSKNHYMEWNDSSSPTLPTIKDTRCEIWNTSNYHICTVYTLKLQDTLQGGQLNLSNRVRVALARRHSRPWVSCLSKDTLQRGWL